MSGPGQRRGPATTPAPVNATAAKLQVPLQGMARRSISEPRHVLCAGTYLVTGRSGRQRLLLVVGQCPFCSRTHVHYAPAGFESARRGASCGHVYVVHALSLEAAA